MLQTLIMRNGPLYTYAIEALPKGGSKDLVAAGTSEDGMAVAVKWFEEHHLQELHRLWGMMSRVKGHVSVIPA
jgi:hypothetical protein